MAWVEGMMFGKKVTAACWLVTCDSQQVRGSFADSDDRGCC